MGTPNPRWFNQRNDGRLARYFTAIYCKRDGVLLMTPLPFSTHPPLVCLFSLDHTFFSPSTLSSSFTLCTQNAVAFSLHVPCPTLHLLSKTRGLSGSSVIQTWLHFCFIPSLRNADGEWGRRERRGGGSGRVVGGPLTAPVSVPVCAVVWARPPAAPPNFREPEQSRLSGTLRFDSHGVEILIAPACLTPLQKRVSRNKDMSINTQDSAEVVCVCGAVC